jgi:hypothetical protein
MAQHIRTKREEEDQQMMMDQSLTGMVSSQMQRIRHSPKMMIGWIIVIILLAIVVAVGGHYMRYWTIPKVSFIPQKPAPSSHLQYFFF